MLKRAKLKFQEVLRSKCNLSIKPNKIGHKTKSKGRDKTTPFIHSTAIKSMMSACTYGETTNKGTGGDEVVYGWNHTNNISICNHIVRLLFSPIQNKTLLSHSPGVPHNIRSMSQRIRTEAGFAGMQTRVFILPPRLQGSWIRRAEYSI